MSIKELFKQLILYLNGEYEVIEAEIIESSELINKEVKRSKFARRN